MTLNRIGRIQDCGVFRDFTWPADLPEFARYNLIYGWNGSGKTTLSRLLRSLELRSAPPSGKASVRIGGNDIGGENFAQTNVSVKVFNRNFIEESVFPTDGGEVAPIYVLGKENVEKQKQIDEAKRSLGTAQSQLSTARTEKSNTERSFSTFCTDRGREISNLLVSTGAQSYKNYDKRNFERRAEQMVSAGDKDSCLLSDSAKDSLLAQLRGSPKAKVPPLSFRLPDLLGISRRVTALLSREVASSAIKALKDDAQLSDWVRSGLSLHQERQSQTCLFCSQHISEERLAALAAHFSTEYEELMQSLAAEAASIRSSIDTCNQASMSPSSEVYEDMRSEYESAVAAFRGERDSVVRVLDSLAKTLENKKASAFKAISLSVAVHTPNTGVVDNLNAVILKHNQACDASEARLDAARTQLEADAVAACLDRYLELKTMMETKATSVREAEARQAELTKRIADLEREIVQHQRPAEELNKDLHSYLGHCELRLEVKKTGYSVMRADAPAVSLSEGERTAIALLYFLKTLQDRRFDLTKGVVVLDDPVSSLDANALFSAFGFIRDRTQNATQLIILTHNFTFFRQVRNWFHHLKGQNKKKVEQRPARFYMLECRNGANARCSGIQWLDPLLERFDSEYHYLFAHIYRTAMAEPHVCLEQSYMLPNLGRRLLESFLAFRQPQIAGELWEKLKLLTFDETKKIRIIRFLHTHSHGGSLGEPEHDLSLLSEAQSILKDLLSLMQSQDGDHFSAMVSLVAASETEEDDAEEGGQS